MSNQAVAWDGEAPPPPEDPTPRPGLTNVLEELDRLRAENRRLAVSLGAFSAWIASKGMLEEAWDYVHRVHGLDEG